MDADLARILLFPLGVAALWGSAYIVGGLIKYLIPDGRVKRFLFKRR